MSYDFELTKIESSIKDKDKEISVLNEQRSKLGIFDGKKKKVIDSSIISLQNEKSALEESMTSKINGMIEEGNVRAESIKNKYKNNFIAQLQSISKGVGFDFSNVKLEKGMIFEAGYYRYEPIKWRVLDIEGDKAYIITENIIDVKPFDKRTDDFRYSIIKNFLNTDFQDEVCVKPADDCITLLSQDEAKKYFVSDDDRKAIFTEYALKSHVGVYNNNGYGYWWLRTRYLDSRACTVSSRGDIYNYNCIFIDEGVRPAMWISIN